MEQRVAVCEGPAGEEIAYATVGDGPVLVLAAWWTSHLELDWQNDELRDFILALADAHTVVRYDRPGVGMSGREPRGYDLDTEVGHLQAVVEAATDGPVDLLGISCGGPPSLTLAHRHPDRVRRLVFFGSYADGATISDQETRDAVRGLVAANWGLGSQALTSVLLPDSDSATARRFAASQRHTASAEVAASLLQLTFDMDVSELAPEVDASTLVLHRERDRVVGIEQGRALADLIPGAEMRVLEGRSHLPWAEHAAGVAGEVVGFLTGGGRKATTRQLATVAFTDIVDSTVTMESLGDERWRDRLEQLTRIVDAEASSRGGRMVKDTGDGAVVTFDLPSDAFTYAIAMRARARQVGLEIRAGVHTGEIELRGDDITGRTVVVAARLCDAAQAGQILTTATTAALAAGRGFRTVQIGERTLKGLEGPAALLDVEPEENTGSAGDRAYPRFARVGGSWEISYLGTTIPVRHSKGIADLAILVGSPGTDIDVTDLMDEPDAPRRSTGTDVLDEQAIASYRRRLGEIEAALDRADLEGDPEGSQALDEEKAALLRELRVASGLGQRTRRLGDDVERARKAVSARVRDAIRKLGESHPELAAHLDETITTGRHCRYR